jgi:hypothetical protein
MLNRARLRMGNERSQIDDEQKYNSSSSDGIVAGRKEFANHLVNSMAHALA